MSKEFKSNLEYEKYKSDKINGPIMMPQNDSEALLTLHSQVLKNEELHKDWTILYLHDFDVQKDKNLFSNAKKESQELMRNNKVISMTLNDFMAQKAFPYDLNNKKIKIIIAAHGARNTSEEHKILFGDHKSTKVIAEIINALRLGVSVSKRKEIEEIAIQPYCCHGLLTLQNKEAMHSLLGLSEAFSKAQINLITEKFGSTTTFFETSALSSASNYPSKVFKDGLTHDGMYLSKQELAFNRNYISEKIDAFMKNKINAYKDQNAILYDMLEQNKNNSLKQLKNDIIDKNQHHHLDFKDKELNKDTIKTIIKLSENNTVINDIKLKYIGEYINASTQMLSGSLTKNGKEINEDDLNDEFKRIASDKIKEKYAKRNWFQKLLSGFKKYNKSNYISDFMNLKPKDLEDIKSKFRIYIDNMPVINQSSDLFPIKKIKSAFMEQKIESTSISVPKTESLFTQQKIELASLSQKFNSTTSIQKKFALKTTKQTPWKKKSQLSEINVGTQERHR